MTTTDTIILAPEDFIRWVGRARPGLRCVYHRTGWDRQDYLFTYGADQFRKGKVLLFQRRNRLGQTEWVAQRCTANAKNFLDRISASVYCAPRQLKAA